MGATLGSSTTQFEFQHEAYKMALIITSDCVNCTVCESVCPNEAIAPGDGVFVIDPDKCTECVGHYEESQCIDVCPVECIVINPNRVESVEDLEAKAERLKAALVQERS